MPSSRPVSFSIPIKDHDRLKRIAEDFFPDANRLARWIVMQELRRGVRLALEPLAPERSREAGAGNDAGPQA
jgi:hypothetical protein